MTREAFSTCGPIRIAKSGPVRAKLLNEVLAEMDAADQHAELTANARRAVVKVAATLPSTPTPSPATMSGVAELIARASCGYASPDDLDAAMSSHVRKSMMPEDRGNLPAAFDRLAKSGDRTLADLYAARRVAAMTFGKSAIARAAGRDAAAQEAAAVEAEIRHRTSELRRQFPGRFTEATAYAEVLQAEKGLYGRYIAAKTAAKP